MLLILVAKFHKLAEATGVEIQHTKAWPMMPSNDFDLVRRNPGFRKDVIFSLSDLVEKNGVVISDVKKLSYEKDVILYAFLFEIAQNSDKREVDAFSAGALLLANFQPNIGRKVYSKYTIDKLLSAPIFENDELSEKDRQLMSKQLEFIQLNTIISSERMEIWKQVNYSRYLNYNMQPFFEKIRRTLWSFIRPCIYAVVFFSVLLLSIALLITPSQWRVRFLQKPSRWINWLSEKPKYEWEDPPVHLS